MFYNEVYANTRMSTYRNW